MITTDKNRAERLLEHLAIIVIIMIACTGVYSGRGLYADGPVWLYEMLLRKGFYIFDPHREYAQYLVELPFAVSVGMGARELNFLIKLHSFGFIAMPIAAWLIALLLQRNNRLFWVLLLAFTVTYLRTGFFAAGEFNITNALVALSFSIVMLEKIGYKTLALLVFCALILTKSYESMSFFGLFLCVVTASRIATNKTDARQIRMGLFAAGILNLIGSFFAIKSILFERSYDLKSTGNISAIFEFHLLYLEIIVIVLFLLILVSNKKITRLLKIFTLIVSLLYVLYAIKWDHSGVSYGYYNYAYRSFGAFLLLGILFSEYLISIFPKLKRTAGLNSKSLTIVSSCAFFTMTIFLLAHTLQYYQWLKRFEKEALSVQGFVHIDQTAINGKGGWLEGVNWPWSNAMLSIILRGNAEGVVLNASDFNGYEHIDPRKVEKYPLSDYYKNGLY